MHEKNKTLICRPGTVFWCVALLYLMTCLVLALSMIIGHPLKSSGHTYFDLTPAYFLNNWITLSSVGALAALGLALADLALRGNVIADGRGLRWRFFLRWKQVRWDEIMDTYATRAMPSDTPLAPIYVVETPVGNLRIYLGTCFNIPDLLETIQVRCRIPPDEAWK